MIRTILFDMGNVLVNFSHERMCSQMGALCERQGVDVRTLLIDSGLQWEFERGRLTPDEFHREFERRVERTIDRDALFLAGSDIFTANAEMLPVLEALKRQGHRLVLLSNTSVPHFEFVRERFGVLQFMDDYVTSFTVGAVKPEPAIFEAALRAIQCRPEECFYTDDIAPYVEAGRTHGLQAEVFTDVRSLRRHLTERGVALEL